MGLSQGSHRGIVMQQAKRREKTVRALVMSAMLLLVPLAKIG
jgi:hypothetical protein